MDYFIEGPLKKANVVASVKIIQELHDMYSDVYLCLDPT